MERFDFLLVDPTNKFLELSLQHRNFRNSCQASLFLWSSPDSFDECEALWATTREILPTTLLTATFINHYFQRIPHFSTLQRDLQCAFPLEHFLWRSACYIKTYRFQLEQLNTAARQRMEGNISNVKSIVRSTKDSLSLLIKLMKRN